MTVPDFGCQISCPPRWLRLPIERPADRAWAEAEAGVLLGEFASGENVAALADQLEFWCADCAGRGPVMALVLVPEAATAVLAVTELQVYGPGDDGPPVTVEWLVGNLGMDRPGALTEPVSSLLELPAGQAVRVRGVYAEQPGEDGRGAVVECVLHAIRPEEIGEVLLLSTSWTMLAFGDALAEVADDLARELEIVPS